MGSILCNTLLNRFLQSNLLEILKLFSHNGWGKVYSWNCASLQLESGLTYSLWLSYLDQTLAQLLFFLKKVLNVPSCVSNVVLQAQIG